MSSRARPRSVGGSTENDVSSECISHFAHFAYALVLERTERRVERTNTYRWAGNVTS